MASTYCPDMFSSIVGSFRSYDSILYFVYISSHKVIGNLEVTASTFGAFLFCHIPFPFPYLLNNSPISLRSASSSSVGS